MISKESIFAQEGRRFPGATYAEVVLAPAYDEAKNNMYNAMMAVNKAHLIMLVEQGLVVQDDANAIMKAIIGLDGSQVVNGSYTGEFEDLFFQIEHMLLAAAGDVAGNLHLARSRNDMGVAMYRMVIREKLLAAMQSLLALQHCLRVVAKEHAETVMLGYTHTQQAQPTTLAHYLMAVHDSLGRDFRRLEAAYLNCNCSPLGAAAITTSGFAINRYRVAELLAFDGLVENSWDAIGGGDYLGEAAAALQVSFLGLGRFVQDLLLWATQEFGAIVVADPYVQISSIMPQKRNPVSLEHIRSLCSSGVGSTTTVLTMLHNTPFGDIVDTEDDMQPYIWKSAQLADQLYRLLTVVLGTIEVRKDILLKRAQDSFATVTELADTLVRHCRLSFRTAHGIASRTVKLAMAQGLKASEVTADLVNQASQEVLGKPLDIEQAVIAKALDPVHFVQIRTLPGGPAPQEVYRLIDSREESAQEKEQWQQLKVRRIKEAYDHLDVTAAEWGGKHG